MNIFPQIKNKSVLILGIGREGLSTYLFLRKHFPDKVLTIADKLSLSQLPEKTRSYISKDKKVKLILGENFIEKSIGFDIIFVSPGMSPLILEKIKNPQSIVSSNLELFFELCQGKIIGITGTKGKSTTTSLIYQVLKQAGLDTRLAGNIGQPALAFLSGANSNTIFVLELSSYQLMRLRRSPHIAVVQNIVPEHLDYHGSFKKYVTAKENIVKYQTKKDYVIYNSLSNLASKIAEISPAKKIPFGHYSKEIEKTILPIKFVPLKGKFNLQNVLPAVIIGKLFGISNEKIASAIKSFKPLEHRLEYVGTIAGIDYYNDSLSTIPESAIAAITAFPNKSLILLLGGYDRGLDFSNLAKVIRTSKIKGVILFPTTGKKIWEAIKKEVGDHKKLPRHVFVSKMKQAVEQAHLWAKKGDVILMSPASASFSVFKDYKDRGDQFKKEVSKLAESEDKNNKNKIL